ncbi:hypothetical protein [Yoonia sp. SS1-5]|uniref:STAS domain-containing protein n=1 Tax=Yoonia rhodophyticola TaxID=3137370 RepID=A0AAN0MCI7_9RHOB
MKLEDCQALHAFLSQSQADGIALNAANVTRLPGLAAQLIDFAARQWTANDLPFVVAQPNEGFIDSLETMGFQDLLFTMGAAQ